MAPFTVPNSMFCLLLVCLLHGSHCDQPINVTFGDVTQLALYEGQQRTVNVTVEFYEGTDRLTLYCESENTFNFVIVNETFARFEITPENEFPVVFPVTVKGKFISISDLRIMATAVGSDISELVASLVVRVNVGNNAIQGILNYAFYAPLMLVFFMMGATLDVPVIVDGLKHPIPIFIGFFCQFLVMPAISVGIGKMLRLEENYALGLLMMGCSPGGKLSNDLTILLDADVVLSITMTACSTLLALGMMPLNIFIYSRFVTTSAINTPFAQIAMQIAILLSPILLGLLMKYKFPKIKLKVLKILKPIVIIVMLIAFAMAIPFSWYIFLSPGKVYGSAILLSFGGVFLGGLIAKVLRLPNKKVVAISLETGVQNGLFATVVLRGVFMPPESNLASSVPTLSFISMVIIGLIAVLCRSIQRRFFNKEGEEDTEDIIKGPVDQGKEMVEYKNGDSVVLTSISSSACEAEDTNTGYKNVLYDRDVSINYDNVSSGKNGDHN